MAGDTEWTPEGFEEEWTPDGFEEEAPAAAPPSQLEAAGRGALQGASMGFADESAGVYGTYGAVVKEQLNDLLAGRVGFRSPAEMKDKLANLLDSYRSNRDESRAANAAAQAAHPKTFIAGSVAGGLATAPLTGGSSAGATWLARAGQAAKTGLGMGVVGGIGANETDGVGGMLRDGAVGGLTGSVLGGGLSALGSGAKEGTKQLLSSDALRRFASNRALNASGYIGNDLKPMFRQHGAERVTEMGQELLESGAIRPGADVSAIAKALEEPLQQAGDDIGAVLSRADSTGARFDMRPFVDRVLAKYAKDGHDPIIRSYYESVVEPLLMKYEQSGAKAGGLSFTEAEGLKRSLQKVVNFGNKWSNTAPELDPNEFRKALQSELRDEVEQQVGKVLGADDMAAFQDAKSRWGIFADALDKAKMGEARTAGNAKFGVRDLLAGSGLSQLGDGSVESAALAVGGAALSKLARERGDSVLATGAQRLANSFVPKVATGAGNLLGSGLERAALPSARLASTEAPATNYDTFRSTVARQPERLGAYAGQFQEAHARGDKAVAALYYVLQSRDPAFQSLLKSLEAP